jgi:hypothetical protein
VRGNPIVIIIDVAYGILASNVMNDMFSSLLQDGDIQQMFIPPPPRFISNLYQYIQQIVQKHIERLFWLLGKRTRN